MVTLGHTDITAADLSEIALFALLSEQQRHRLLDQHRGVTFSPDQLLMLDQDESQGLILLRNGIAKVRRYNSEGEEDVLSLLGPGDVCGEMAVLNNGRRSADVVSVTTCDAVFLRVGPFRQVGSTALAGPQLSFHLAGGRCHHSLIGHTLRARTPHPSGSRQLLDHSALAASGTGFTIGTSARDRIAHPRQTASAGHR